MGIDRYVSFLGSFIRVSDELADALRNIGKEVELKRGEKVLDEGSTCRHLYFLVDGTLRTYYFHEGKDVTSWIYAPNMVVTSWKSYVFEAPSDEMMEATEATQVVKFKKSELEKVYENFPDFERAGRLHSEYSMAIIEEFYRGFMFQSAEQKLRTLVSYYPDVTQRANLGHIASFLGISQETLSRIRKKMS